MQIAVVPEALSTAGSGLGGTAAEIVAANATMSAAASGVPGACGFPEPEAPAGSPRSRVSPTRRAPAPPGCRRPAAS
jgi:hypothetical protein